MMPSACIWLIVAMVSLMFTRYSDHTTKSYPNSPGDARNSISTDKKANLFHQRFDEKAIRHIEVRARAVSFRPARAQKRVGVPSAVRPHLSVPVSPADVPAASILIMNVVSMPHANRHT